MPETVVSEELTMSEGRTSRNWISRGEVSRRLEITGKQVDALVAAGRLSVRDLPGRYRFNAEEVEALAVSCITRQNPAAN